jgi:ectoine hydroxylase-related dioxygenase (phytanoyl-CoA dioxygenase family)
MAQAPAAGIAALDGADDDGKSGAAALETDGFLRVNGAMSPETARTLRAYIEAQLSEKRAEADTDLGAQTSNFGDVLMRENRYDLLLDLAPAVQTAAHEVLSSLKPTFASVLGEDAELFELAALISDPRAPRQPAHPDTPYRTGEGAAVVTAFVALQDVDEDMGPTSVIPRTHTQDAHERFNNKDDGGRERVALLRETPNHIGVLRTGDANLIDSRVIHCGGANDSSQRRVLFYISFRRRGKVTPSGSMLYKHRRAGYGLDNVDRWATVPV